MRLVILKTDERNGHLENVLDVDLKITSLQNVQRNQNRTRNGIIKYFLMKKVIVYVTTAKKTENKIYMHLWHAYLVLTNVLVEILVTVHNRPIGFWILEQRVT